MFARPTHSIRVAILAIGLLAGSAQGISITVDGQVVWWDGGFENDTPGSGPNPPAIGTYSTTGDVAVYGPDDDGPGAFSGNNYLRLFREPDGARPNLTADLPDLVPGQILSASFAINNDLGQTGPGWSNFALRTSGNPAWPASHVQLFYTSSVEVEGAPGTYHITYYHLDSGHTPTGFTYTPGEWLAIQLSWVVGAAEMDLTVNGTTATIPVWQPDLVVDRWEFDTGGPTLYYLDAVSLFADDCDEALPVGLGTLTGSTAGATIDGNSGCGGDNDVWASFTSPITGNIKIDTCGSAFATVISLHTGDCGSLTEVGCGAGCADAACGEGTCLTANVSKGTTYLIRVAGEGGATGGFDLNISAASAPPNDDCRQAEPVDLGTHSGTTVNATSEGTAPSCGNSSGAPDVWYMWTARGTETLRASTCVSFDLDTVVSVYTGDCETGLVEIGCNDQCVDDPTCAPTSCRTVDVVEGETYLIRVAGNAGAEEQFDLQLSGGPTVEPLPEAILIARDGNVVWQDDGFEDDTPGSGPNPPMRGGASTTGLVIVLGPDDDGPGAYHGDNYLSLFRGDGRPNLTADLPEFETGQVLSVHFAFQSAGGHPNFSIRAPGGGWPDSYMQLMYFWPPAEGETVGSITYYHLDTGHSPTGFTHTINEWHTVGISWVVGAPEMRLTVNGAAGTIPVWQPDSTVDRWEFDTGGPAQSYLDAVPIGNLGGCSDLPFDVDEDDDVDQRDYAAFQVCLSGDGVEALAGCGCLDRDEDGDVDLIDLVFFEGCASGPAIPADPACDDDAPDYEHHQSIDGAVIYDHDSSTRLGDHVFGNIIADFGDPADERLRCSHGGPVCMEYANGTLVAFYANTSSHNVDGWSEYASSNDRGRTWDNLPVA